MDRLSMARQRSIGRGKCLIYEPVRRSCNEPIGPLVMVESDQTRTWFFQQELIESASSGFRLARHKLGNVDYRRALPRSGRLGRRLGWCEGSVLGTIFKAAFCASQVPNRANLKGEA
jgi:hypothetical protein